MELIQDVSQVKLTAIKIQLFDVLTIIFKKFQKLELEIGLLNTLLKNRSISASISM